MKPNPKLSSPLNRGSSGFTTSTAKASGDDPSKNMKPIPTEFTGTRDQAKISEKLPAYRFKMLKRFGMTCLFEKSRGGTAPKSYEVVILQQCQKKTWPDGRVTEAHEKMPRPEEWGTLGWTYLTLEEAMRKFRFVSEPEPEKSQN